MSTLYFYCYFHLTDLLLADDQIAAAVNCTGANSLSCLRHAPYNELLAAVDQTPNFLSYESLRNAWVPRTDGRFLAKDGQVLMQQGKIAPVPFVIGDWCVHSKSISSEKISD